MQDKILFQSKSIFDPSLNQTKANFWSKDYLESIYGTNQMQKTNNQNS